MFTGMQVAKRGDRDKNCNDNETRPVFTDISCDVNFVNSKLYID